jgi:hypothetical protein
LTWPFRGRGAPGICGPRYILISSCCRNTGKRKKSGLNSLTTFAPTAKRFLPASVMKFSFLYRVPASVSIEDSYQSEMRLALTTGRTVIGGIYVRAEFLAEIPVVGPTHYEVRSD